jgi:hypothetical protein
MCSKSNIKHPLVLGQKFSVDFHVAVGQYGDAGTIDGGRSFGASRPKKGFTRTR